MRLKAVPAKAGIGDARGTESGLQARLLLSIVVSVDPLPVTLAVRPLPKNLDR
jgi:hypothetical protein